MDYYYKKLVSKDNLELAGDVLLLSQTCNIKNTSETYIILMRLLFLKT